LNLSFQEHVGRKVHGNPKKSIKIARYQAMGEIAFYLK
jgi:hypothetical protein